jgi:hypothetical protein
MSSIHKGENHYNKTGRQEVDSLAYLGPKTVQTMGGSSSRRLDHVGVVATDRAQRPPDIFATLP